MSSEAPRPDISEALNVPDIDPVVWTYTDREILCFYAAREELGLEDRLAIGFSVITPETAPGLAELIKYTRERERLTSPTGRNRIEMMRDPTAEDLLNRRHTQSALAVRGEPELINRVWVKASSYMEREDGSGLPV